MYVAGMSDDDDLAATREAIKKHRKITRRGGLPPWTPIDPALAGVMVGASDPPPPLWVGKLWRRLHEVLDLFGRTFASRAIRAILGAMLFTAIYLYFVSEGGAFAVLNEAASRVTAIVASVISGSIIFVGDFIAAMLWSRRTGAWYGREYVFDTPKQVLAVQVSAADNDKAFVVPTPMALPASFVTFIVRVERQDDRVKAQLNLAPGGPIYSAAAQREMGLRLSKRGPVFLTVSAAAEALPTMVRVLMKSISYDTTATQAKITGL